MSKGGPPQYPPAYTANPNPVGFTHPPPNSAPPPYGAASPYPQPPPGSTVVNMPPPAGSSTVHVVHTTQPTVIRQQAYVVPAAGVCPACRTGVLTSQFTCCGIFLGICLFPIGMICCFLMTEKRCTNCGTTFG